MFKVRVTEVEAATRGGVPFSFQTDAETMDANSEAFSFVGSIVAVGKAFRDGQFWRVQGTITCEKAFVCDRCLKACRETQNHAFAEEFTAGDADSGVHFLDENTVDLMPLVRDILLAAQPLRQVCRPDCRGLCPKCGKDLNEGACDCDTFVPDPRLAALQDWTRKKDPV